MAEKGLLCMLLLLSVVTCLGETSTTKQPLLRVGYGSSADAFIFNQDEGKVLNVTLYNFTGNFDANNKAVFLFKSADENVFTIDNFTGIEIVNHEGVEIFPVSLNLHLKGVNIGISEIVVTQLDQTSGQDFEVSDHSVKVLKIDTILDILFLYLVLAWLVLSYLTMGAKMELKVVGEKFRPPTAPIIGMICQFGVMPAIAFGLAKLFKLDRQTALGLIFVGTCPGGYLSNLFSLLLDCDFVLSLTMTAFSTVLCLGFMPLNLFIYANPLIQGNENLQTPFIDLFIQLVLLILPVGIGMVAGYFFPKVRLYCDKLLKPIATICILVSLAFGIPANLYIFSSPWESWLVSILLPFLGCVIGLVVAKITCLKRPQAITVALETGAQNSLLANTILDLFYPKPESDLVGRIPLLIAMLSLAEGTAIVIIYCIKEFFYPSKDKDDDDIKDKDVDFTPGNNGVMNEGLEIADDLSMFDMKKNNESPDMNTFKVTAHTTGTDKNESDAEGVDEKNTRL